MKPTRWCLAFLLCLAPGLAEATSVVTDLGLLDLEGLFTVARSPFATPADEPWGFFADLTVTASEGTFAPHVPLGTTLPARPLQVPDAWPLGDLVLSFAHFQSAGAPSFGMTVLATPVFGLDDPAHPDDFVFWQFEAPPFDSFPFEPVTGPITLTIRQQIIREVPEPATVSLLALGLVGLVLARKRWA